ncbi:efflux RND transporter permease subunit [Thalassoglobus sp. JC818]|uniref:efflux RND transporter permease subunit n=1 Tax=Thalassoglobus sp. JC818 TaxID=3232136 RepID=UPI00345B2EEC
MSVKFQKAFGWTVDRRGIVWALLFCLTAVSALGYVAPDMVWKLFEPAPAVVNETSTTQQTAPRQAAPDVEVVSLTDSEVILVIDSSQFFTVEGSQALKACVSALEELDYVESVLWIDEVPPLNIFGLRESFFPGVHASERQFEQAREIALAHPLVGGQLLSRDGETTLLMVQLNWFFVESDEAVTDGLRRAVKSTLKNFPTNDFEVLVTGPVPMYLTFITSQEANRFKYQIIGYGMVLLMAVILFRGFRAVMIVAIAPTLGVFWTIGLVSYFELQDNPFIDIVLPILLSMVGLTDGVHLMVEIRRQRASGLSEKEAAKRGIQKVGLACLLTSLTTAIGFGSLSMAHHQVIREFGWACVLGVIVTFIAVITSIPLACSTWLGRSIHHGHERGLIDRNLSRISVIIDFVLGHARVVGILGIVITFAFTAISLTLRPDDRRTTGLPMKSEAARAIDHMDQAFGGLELGFVEVTWDPEVPSDSAEVLKVVTEVDDALREEPLLGSPLSIRSFIDALPGDGDFEERMPLLELLPPPLKRSYYSPEKRSARIQFRVQDLGIAKYAPVFERVREECAAITRDHPGFEVRLGGEPVRRWESLFQIVMDLVYSLGSASLIIFVVLSLAYRSLRLGLISIIPNVFPLAVTGVYLVVTGQTLEIVSVCAFTVCLGIAVDDTIHFLTRYEEERAELQARGGGSEREAIRRAFIGTGTALIMTTAVLVVGFATVMFSDMRDQRIFASMAGLTISAALFGDLVFLPALLSFFGESDSRSDDSTDPQLDPRSAESSEEDSSDSMISATLDR